MSVTTHTCQDGTTAVRIRGNCTGQQMSFYFATREDAAALLKALRKRVR